MSLESLLIYRFPLYLFFFSENVYVEEAEPCVPRNLPRLEFTTCIPLVESNVFCPLYSPVNWWLDLEAWSGLGSVFLVCFRFGEASRPAVCCLFRKLHQSQLELQEARLSYRQLQGKVEELTEERSLQSCAATSTSLLSEIEQSMEAEELEQEREQVLLSCRSGMCEVAQGL